MTLTDVCLREPRGEPIGVDAVDRRGALARTHRREDAARVAAEVEALYPVGPAGGRHRRRARGAGDRLRDDRSRPHRALGRGGGGGTVPRGLAHVRTGDKGDLSQLAVIACRKANYQLLATALDTDRVRAHLPGLGPSVTIVRHELPSLAALLFVAVGALTGGVTRSLSLDAHGKALRTQLLDVAIGPNRIDVMTETTASPIQPIDAPEQPGEAIPLGTGVAPAEMPPESWVSLFGKPTVRNVGEATLTPILPDADTATGAAVVVAAGGAFVMQSMQNEAWAQARWLADRGIAAFVLKYRLLPTPAPIEQFREAMIARFAAAVVEPGQTRRLETLAEAVADGQAAVRLVRRRAADWGVDPRRIGYFGSSAGAMIGLGMVTANEPDALPDFLATIYPSMARMTVPDSAPPLFVAMASDDQLFGTQGYGLAEAWRLARGKVELHVYERGGHGFGMGAPGTTSVGLMDAYLAWLGAGGWLAPRGAV